MSQLEFSQLCYFMSNHFLGVGSLCTCLISFYSGVTLFYALDWKLIHDLEQNHAGRE